MIKYNEKSGTKYVFAKHVFDEYNLTLTIDVYKELQTKIFVFLVLEEEKYKYEKHKYEKYTFTSKSDTDLFMKMINLQEDYMILFRNDNVNENILKQTNDFIHDSIKQLSIFYGL